MFNGTKSQDVEDKQTRISSATSKGSHFPTAVTLQVIGAETPEARTVWKKLQ